MTWRGTKRYPLSDPRGLPRKTPLWMTCGRQNDARLAPAEYASHQRASRSVPAAAADGHADQARRPMTELAPRRRRLRLWTADCRPPTADWDRDCGPGTGDRR